MSDFADPFERLVADACPPDTVRAVEGGGSPAALWSRLDASGFVDALVPEASGGAGLALADVFELIVAEGRHVLPVPFAHTMLARALLARAGVAAPAGMIAIAPRTRIASANAAGTAGGPSAPAPDTAIACPGTPYGLVADWVVAALPDAWLLLPTDAAERTPSGVHASLRADLRWPQRPPQAVVVPHALAWDEVGAAITAAQLAGALQRTLEMAVGYANERVQFGRSIGKFQAIQHPLAVAAEQVSAARIAAEIGCTGDGVLPRSLRAALAKARAGEAAAIVTGIAHAVHGAIGVTAEYDLQLLTRRCHEWRADFGSEQHWNRVVGRALLAAPGATLDFMRTALIPANEELRR